MWIIPMMTLNSMFLSTFLTGAEAESAIRVSRVVPPAMLSWFWQEPEFEYKGYTAFIDLASKYSGANLLTTSLRLPEREVTDDAVREQIAAAVKYARDRGIGIVMDLDVRLARKAFYARYPNEMQEMLRLREVLLEADTVSLKIPSDTLSDHYTARATPYIPLSGRLVRVYAYERGPDGILPQTVRDITTSHCAIREANASAVSVDIVGDSSLQGMTACVMVAFAHFTPDVFAPRLLSFQRDILAFYRDIPLAGACKDEWGFPPCFDGCPAKNDYWFSRWYAEAYADRTGGRDLVRDCLLMTFGESGRDRERQAAINTFLAMSTERNAAIENDFYAAVKGTFGEDALVATHPTWYPYPGTQEFKKNGLHWWQTRRDFAQTDEVTPYCARTSLAKKWNSPVWHNMYYDTSIDSYHTELWANALSGGRINYHPLFPFPEDLPYFERYEVLLRGELMQGESRVRLLNYITDAPLDCPVALIFGHACAMNWAGPAYDDVGIGLSDKLWEAGFPTDLIPSSEISNGSLHIGDDGRITYGRQAYAAVVLYHPEFETPETARFFAKASEGPTRLFRTGEWTRDFSAADYDGAAFLPKSMEVLESPEQLTTALIENGITPQQYTTRIMTGFGRTSLGPGRKGHTRLLDGTHVIVHAEENAAGDPIRERIIIGNTAIDVDALGIIAVRLDKGGSVESLAAGGLRYFAGAGLRIELENRINLALWTKEKGAQQYYVVLDHNAEVPDAKNFSAHCTFLRHTRTLP